MGSQNVLGLLMQINADPSQAQAALDSFNKSTGDSLNKLSSAGQKAGDELGKGVEKGLINSHQSVHLLAEEMGIRLPRAVVGAVSEMLPAINSIGPALLGIFAIDMAVKFGEKLHKVSEEANGVAAAEKRMGEAIKENDGLILELARHSAQAAQQQLLAINAEIGAMQREAEQRRAYFNLNPILYAFGVWTGGLKDVGKLEDQVAEKERQRNELLKIFTEDNVKAQEKAAAAEEAHAVALFGAWTNGPLRGYEAYLSALHAGQAYEEQRAARLLSITDIQNKANLQALEIYEGIFASDKSRSTELAEGLIPKIQQQTTATKHLSEAQRELQLITQQLEGAMVKEESAIAKSTIATIVHGVAAGESFKKVAHAAIASVAEQSAIQAIWELAQGLAMEALFFFMPDPRYQASADAHFASAAVYGGIGAIAGGAAAATRSARGAGAGGGGGDYGGRYGGGGGGRDYRDRQDQYDPNSLAAGADDRTGVVVVYGSQSFHAFIADSVSTATERGYTVTATSAQRGAAVGH